MQFSHNAETSHAYPVGCDGKRSPLIYVMLSGLRLAGLEYRPARSRIVVRTKLSLRPLGITDFRARTAASRAGPALFLQQQILFARNLPRFPLAESRFAQALHCAKGHFRRRCQGLFEFPRFEQSLVPDRKAGSPVLAAHRHHRALAERGHVYPHIRIRTPEYVRLESARSACIAPESRQHFAR